MAQTYGPIFKIYVGSKLYIVISNPELAKVVFRDQDENFSNQNAVIATSIVSYGGQDIVWSDINSNWRNLRKIFVQEVLSNKNLQECSSFRRNEVRKTIKNVFTKIGAKDGHIVAELHMAVSKIFKLMGIPNASDFITSLAWLDLQGVVRDMKREFQRMDQIFTLFINDRIKSNSKRSKDAVGHDRKKDLLQILLELNDQKELHHLALHKLRHFSWRMVFCSSLDCRPIRGKNVETLINSEAFKTLDDNDAVSLCCVGILQLVLLGLEDRRPVPNWILRLANDRDGCDNYPWGSHVWPTLYQQLKDANVRRWLALYATQPKYEVDKKSYSITGFAWAFKTWILESFRAATNKYFTRYRRLPRVVAWRSKNTFYRNMLKPFLHVSSRAYFDGRNIEEERIPRHLNRNNYFEVPLEMYREFEEQWRGYKQMMEKSDDMYEKMSRFMEDMNVGPMPLAKEPIIADQHYGIIDLSGFQSYQGVPSTFRMLANSSSFFNMATLSNWQTPILSYLGTPNSQPHILSHPGTSNWKNLMTSYSLNLPHPRPSHPNDTGLLNTNICDRARRERHPSIYKQSPYTV
uniref:Cytochrome P450 n=1 Tax=Tanacetum cinerariifolium TaxID=118510 RepID=A0A6L2NC53_TANCI|nr:cytochrome P450 [Tanacetum cinerariifolium]